MEIDVQRLRKDLEDYFMSAMFLVSGAAMMDVIDVQNATDEEVINIALNNGFDLSLYTLDDLSL